MNIRPVQNHYLALVIFLTLVVSIGFSWATYYINPWPTDSEGTYLPIAAQLFKFGYISNIHNIPDYFHATITYGKEALILGIAIFQRLLNDYATLFPNTLLLIVAVGISAMLIYRIFGQLLNEHIGFIAFLLFLTSSWPYLYILQGAHPPFALMNFLVAVYFLSCAQKHKAGYFLSGTFLGFMFFSSPMAALYVPYYVCLFIFWGLRGKAGRLAPAEWRVAGWLIILGGLLTALLFTLPNPAKTIQGFLFFMKGSRSLNHFAAYREGLSAFFPLPPTFRGGGILWIWKYFLFIMPILFPAYGIALIYLLKKAQNIPYLWIVAGVSLSTPLVVEWFGVAQFGRVYFSWFLGIIAVIGYALYYFGLTLSSNEWAQRKKIFVALLYILLGAHIGFNGYQFFGEIFPSRMATNRIYQWLIDREITKVYTYQTHMYIPNLIFPLNNPKYRQKIEFVGIESIKDVQDGYILVPPITGKSIWIECQQLPIKDDPHFLELYRSQEFPQYVLASFQTLSSSKAWTQEEEVCTYRDLILHQISDLDRREGYAWLLDGKKLHQQWFKE